ncbi:MAG: glycosyltransferase [Pseudomonadota bacterium]
MAPRIFHVQMGRDGGTERFFVTLSHAFAESGAAQAFAVRPDTGFSKEVEAIGEVHAGPYLRHTPAGLLARAQLRRAIAAFDPDAVLAWRAPAARLIPKHGNFAKLVRLGDYPSHPRHFAHLDAVICNNPDIARHVTKLGYAGRLEVISNFPRPVALKPAPRQRLSTPEGAFVVCGAARFETNKGLDTLVEAVALVPEAILWLIGAGPEEDALRRRVASRGLSERTRFLGWVSEPMDIIASADVFAMPSRDEPLGNALLEAWYAGTASISTATAGPTWYATDQHDCLITPVDDPAAMAAAIDLLRQDAARRDTLVKGARTTLENSFSKLSVVRDYFALISDI